MILTLLLLAGIAALIGWKYTTDIFQGSSLVEIVHELGAEFMVFLFIILHVAGVIFASRAHQQNLVRSMINGRKRAAQDDNVT